MAPTTSKRRAMISSVLCAIETMKEVHGSTLTDIVKCIRKEYPAVSEETSFKSVKPVLESATAKGLLTHSGYRYKINILRDDNGKRIFGERDSGISKRCGLCPKKPMDSGCGMKKRRKVSCGKKRKKSSCGRKKRRKSSCGMKKRRKSSCGRKKRRKSSCGRKKRRKSSCGKKRRRRRSSCGKKRRKSSCGKKKRRKSSCGKRKRRKSSCGKRKRRKSSCGKKRRRKVSCGKKKPSCPKKSCSGAEGIAKMSSGSNHSLRSNDKDVKVDDK